VTRMNRLHRNYAEAAHASSAMQAVGHRWSINIRGRSPPLPDDCNGHGWFSKNTTAAAETLYGVSKAVPGVEPQTRVVAR
jgi:hypothetical protein